MVSGALVYVDIETGEEVSIDCLYDEETERGPRAAAGAPARDLAGAGKDPRAQAPGGRAAPLPPHRAAADPGEAHRGGRDGGAPGREPARRGADRVGQDGGGAPSGAGRGAAAGQAGRLPDVQDAAAEDGGLGARRDERARLLDAPGPREGEDVRQRPDPLPRGLLPLRARLPGEDGAVGHPRAAARDLLRTTIPTRSSKKRAAKRSALSKSSSSSRSAPTRSWPTTTTSSSRASRCGTSSARSSRRRS